MRDWIIKDMRANTFWAIKLKIHQTLIDIDILCLTWITEIESYMAWVLCTLYEFLNAESRTSHKPSFYEIASSYKSWRWRWRWWCKKQHTAPRSIVPLSMFECFKVRRNRLDSGNHKTSYAHAACVWQGCQFQKAKKSNFKQSQHKRILEVRLVSFSCLE